MSMSDVNGSTQPRQQSLLQKYGLVVDCLSFEYIEKCSDKTELEKILKILRSGEEGHYQALEKAAEGKLQKLSPNSHLLRVDDPVISTSALDPEHRRMLSNDFQLWEKEMVDRENMLKFSDHTSSEEVPAIRNPAVSKAVSDKNKMNKSSSKPEKSESATKKRVPKNYSYWDKFDAESEMLKIDLEEERQSERKEKERKEQILKQDFEEQEEKAVRAKMKSASVGAGDYATETEKSFNAECEKNKGNECFRTKDYTSALHHYTTSISFYPTVDAYNNRAITYVKLQKYHEAITDCEAVLKINPSNVKGLYRHGVAEYHLKNYQSALHDFEKALEIDPNNQDCQEYANKVCAQLGITTSSKRVRMEIQDASSSDMDGTKNVTDTEDLYYPFFNTSPNENITLNEIGTAKVMCRCNGTPGFMKKVRSLEDIKEHGRLCLRQSSRSKKRDTRTDKLKQNSSTESNAKCNSSDNVKESSDSGQPVMVEKKVLEPDGKSCELGGKESGLNKVASSRSDSANIGDIKNGYHFIKFWNGIKSTENLDDVAKFLKSTSPEKVKLVVGQMLDDKMLSFFIMALRAHFSLPDDWGIVQRYLLTFTQFPRFKCVSMMLDKKIKIQLESLLYEAEGLGLRVSDLLQLYGLTDSPQS